MSMEWIRINTNKLKIMLTAEDAKRYALRFERVDYTDAGTRRAFRSILTDIKKETGFDATEDRVYIQLYPSREGGCELFVTKTGRLTAEADECVHKTPYGDVGEEPPLPRVRQVAFTFGTIQNLLAVCRRLVANRFSGESSAWLDDEHRYWLILTEEKEALARGEAYGFVAEYGVPACTDSALMLLSEHGHEICPHRAVETLGKL